MLSTFRIQGKKPTVAISMYTGVLDRCLLPDPFNLAEEVIVLNILYDR